MGRRTEPTGPTTAALRVPRGRPAAALRLSRDAAGQLRRLRLESPFTRQPLETPAVLAALAVAACTASASFHTWDASGLAASRPEPLCITITVLDHLPEPELLEDPHTGRAAVREVRPAALSAEVPPPPARDIDAPAECPPLVLSLARRVPALPWLESKPGGNGTEASAGRGARATGPATDGDLDFAGFWQGVRGRIAAQAVYPPAAVRRGAAGQVLLRVRVDTQGRLRQAQVATSSTDTALDRAALAAVHQAEPFPAEALRHATGTNLFEALIPIRFELVDVSGDRDWGIAPKH